MSGYCAFQSAGTFSVFGGGNSSKNAFTASGKSTTVLTSDPPQLAGFNTDGNMLSGMRRYLACTKESGVIFFAGGNSLGSDFFNTVDAAVQ